MWHPVGLGTKCQPASGMAHQTLVLLGEGGKGRGEEVAQDKIYLCLCVISTQTKRTDAYCI